MTELSAVCITENATDVRRRIAAAGGDPATVKLLAVTKTFSADVVRLAVEAGLIDVGENYAQEAKAKHLELEGHEELGVQWHFIGRLQRNKVKSIADFIHLWHSVDGPGLIDEIAKRSPGAAILLQVDLAGEPGRGGCSWEEIPALLTRSRDVGLTVRGLMGVAPIGPAEAARPTFRRLAATAGELGLPEVSMGMTADLEVAVEEGATIVRVGRALFGSRLPKPS